jgi:hypothetical protein
MNLDSDPLVSKNSAIITENRVQNSLFSIHFISCLNIFFIKYTWLGSHALLFLKNLTIRVKQSSLLVPS